MLSKKVQEYLNFHRKREYRKQRRWIDFSPIDLNDPNFIAAKVVKSVAEIEDARLYPNDIFAFNRSSQNLPKESDLIAISNVTPDYIFALENGIKGMKNKLMDLKKMNHNDSFYDSAIDGIDSLILVTKKYLETAKRGNNTALYNGLTTILNDRPHSYYEALLMQKALIYLLRLARFDHATLGRFDQYMYPYFIHSLESGEAIEDLLEITELYFISLNIDTDLYYGIQQGDNGQSIVLGGRTREKEDAFNELSEIVLEASQELCLIDPKINVRVNKNTRLEQYERFTELTKKGLGFPQYCNDDVVIPGLINLGYDEKDAIDYVVAACWEFIIPYVSYDSVNIKTMVFPLAIRNAIVNKLKSSKTFDDLLDASLSEIDKQFALRKKEGLDKVIKEAQIPNPITSCFITPCRNKGLDRIEGGAKYYNFGLHGLGFAPAVDALVATKTFVFDKKTISKEELLRALDDNFVGHEETRGLLISANKYGNNDEDTNLVAKKLIDHYSELVNKAPTGRYGGIWRAGTGGSQDYVYMASDVKATADGRRAGEPFPSSFSPSLGFTPNRLLSVISSFTIHDFKKIINGGPLTIEIHDNVFHHQDGIKKVAMLVKQFIDRGGHELQINAIAREKLLDAQKHPEKYPDLIVRVWGWSGYFNELGLCFQNQIISRTEYQ